MLIGSMNTGHFFLLSIMLIAQLLIMLPYTCHQPARTKVHGLCCKHMQCSNRRVGCLYAYRSQLTNAFIGTEGWISSWIGSATLSLHLVTPNTMRLV